MLFSLFNALYFALLCFFLVISLFEMVFKYSAEVLSGVSEQKKTVVHLLEKIRVLDKLLSGMGYSDVGH